MSLSARALGILPALLWLGNCSSHDVSLGEDLPPPTEPVIDPTPPGPPDPTPGELQPCDLARPETGCLLATDHCSGRIITRAGYECSSGYVCCEQTVGGGPAPGGPPGGASGVEPPAAGFGGA